MLKKKYSAKTGLCHVTFRLNPEVNADTAYVCGDFNDWDQTANKMRSLKSGGYSLTLRLEPGQYRFRYWVDGERWENDWEADGYAPNDFGSEDSLVVVDDASAG